MKFLKPASAGLLCFILGFAVAFGQLTGTKTIDSGGGGNYLSFSLAINDLNSQGVGAGGVLFLVAAGQTFNETPPTITATGSASNPVVFRKNGVGANPAVVPSVAGTRSPAAFGDDGDWIFRLQSGDYITFDGIDLQENAAFSGAAQKTEYGFFLVRSGTDGCKHITIKNCSVTLDKSTPNSTAIYVSNLNSAGSAVIVSSTGGRMENISISGVTCANVYNGIHMRGYNHTIAPFTFYDQNLDVGVDAGNTISNFGGGALSAAYGIFVIYGNNIRIHSNTITGGSGTTADIRGITSSTGTNSNLEIVGNDISISSPLTTATAMGIDNAMGGSGTSNTVVIRRNIVHECAFSSATSGSFSAIASNLAPNTLFVDSNIVRDNTLAGTGTFTGIDAHNSRALFMRSNEVFGNQKTGPNGTMYCTRTANSSITFEYNHIYRNSFPSTSGATASLLFGCFNNSAPSAEVYRYNVVDSLTISGASTATGSQVVGMNSITGASTIKTFEGNRIFGCASHIGTVYGVSTSSGSTTTISRNRLYDLSVNGTGSSVYGIYVVSGTTVYADNNNVSDLRAPASVINPAIAAINISSGSFVGLYYNTVMLNATSGAALFGTAGILTSTTPTVDLRNNIIVNVSDAGSGGQTVAYRRTGTNLSTYATVSNNNDLYAGLPGPRNLIFTDGISSDETLAAFKARVAPRDSGSFTELPPFMNVTDRPYDLHIRPDIATLVEGGGRAITSPVVIARDFDADSRATVPDAGADEFTGIPVDGVPPDISVYTLANTSYLSSRQVGAAISDLSGLAFSPDGPRLYYKKSTDAGFVVDASPSGSPPTYQFTVKSSLLGGGVSAGDTIQYYVAAADIHNNSATSPSGGGGMPPGIIAPPVFHSYRILETAAVPFTEDFEINATLPPGWSGGMEVVSGHGSGLSHGLTGRLYSGMVTTSALTLPVGPLTSTTRLEFDYRIVNHADYPATGTVLSAGDSVAVRISTDDGASYSLLSSMTSANHVPGTSFVHVVIPLTPYSGMHGVISWEASWSTGDYDLDIDNVVVAEPPPPPGQAGVVAPVHQATGVSPAAILEWSDPVSGGPVTGYRLYFGTDGGGTVPPTSIMSGTNLGNVLVYDPSPDLTPSMTYYWQVVATGPGGDATGSPIWVFVTRPPTYAILSNAGPNGSISPAGTVPVDSGESVNFSFNPAIGYHLDSVIVDGTFIGAPSGYTFDAVAADHRIRCTFAINTYTLTTAAEHGLIVRMPDLAQYDSNTVVTLTAVPDPGYHFTHWSGDTSGSADPLTVTMDRNMSISGHFSINQYALDVTALHGVIAASPELELYDSNTAVQLTVLPDPGYHFVQWTGDITGSSNPVSVTVHGPMVAVAACQINRYSLTTHAEHGAVVRVPEQALYDSGTVVELTAVPDAGYHFVQWVGVGSGSQNPLQLMMDSSRNVTAVFSINQFALVVSSGHGLVLKNPDLAQYDSSSQVELTAVADPGYSFMGWSGDATGTDNPFILTMDGNRMVTAAFAIKQYVLNTTISGAGTIVRNPDAVEYDSNMVVALTATPTPGYHFAGWSGDASGTDNPLTVLMDGPRNIGAAFAVDSVYQVAFRTASMEDWANAMDAKGKPQLVRCKADRVEFAFSVVAPPGAVSAMIKIDMVSTGSVSRSDTVLAVWAGTKQVPVAGVSPGETLMVRGMGVKGKPVHASVEWATTVKMTRTAVTVYELNQPRLPMPNLVNVLSELGSWPTVGNAMGPHSVIHTKYKDVQKSLNKKGILHSGSPACLLMFDNGRPILKQQKALAPDKHNNHLFAEALTLALNLRASARGNFPPGLGSLLYHREGDVPSETFNGSSLDAILSRANAILGCQPDSASPAECDSVLTAINGAFRDGAIDTLGWSCGGVRMTGVRSLIDVPFLRAPVGFTIPTVAPLAQTIVEPMTITLDRNYPNPFNPSTTIGYVLPDAGIVSMKIYNIIGQEIATLIDGVLMEEGEQEVEFNGAGQPSGVYYYRLTVQSVDGEGALIGQVFSKVEKMILAK